MAKLNKSVLAALAIIQASGTVTSAVGKPLVEQGLIEVNSDDVAAGVDNARARLTPKALAEMPKPKGQPTANAPATTTAFAIITNAVPPESKRGFGRKEGPAKYPFDDLPVGGSFFVAQSAEVENPLKTMGSAVSNATNKHRVDTGTTKKVIRTKRGEGNKAMLDASGNKVKEEVDVPVYNYPVKFIIRSVEAGVKYGEWVAPANGALITREK